MEFYSIGDYNLPEQVNKQSQLKDSSCIDVIVSFGMEPPQRCSICSSEVRPALMNSSSTNISRQLTRSKVPRPLSDASGMSRLVRISFEGLEILSRSEPNSILLYKLAKLPIESSLGLTLTSLYRFLFNFLLQRVNIFRSWRSSLVNYREEQMRSGSLPRQTKQSCGSSSKKKARNGVSSTTTVKKYIRDTLCLVLLVQQS